MICNMEQVKVMRLSFSCDIGWGLCRTTLQNIIFQPTNNGEIVLVVFITLLNKYNSSKYSSSTSVKFLFILVADYNFYFKYSINPSTESCISFLTSTFSISGHFSGFNLQSSHMSLMSIKS